MIAISQSDPVLVTYTTITAAVVTSNVSTADELDVNAHAKQLSFHEGPFISLSIIHCLYL